MTKAHPLRTAIITGIAAGIAWSQWEARAFVEVNSFRRGAAGFLKTGIELLPFHIVPALAVALAVAAISYFLCIIKKREFDDRIDIYVLMNAQFGILGLAFIGSSGNTYLHFPLLLLATLLITSLFYPKKKSKKKFRWRSIILFPIFWWLFSWVNLPPVPPLPLPGESPKKIAQTNLKVLLFAVDGADWKFLQPGIDNGDLPNMELLIDLGASGPLKTQIPTSSPILWTTIATGKNPDKHGIEGWVVYRLKWTGARFLKLPRKSFLTRLNGANNRLFTMTPLTSNYRRCRAIWNVIQDKSVVIGWWVTWPAEIIKGVMVSPYAWPFVDTVMIHENLPTAHPPGSTYPESLMDRLKPLVTQTAEVKKNDFMGVTPETMNKLYPQADVYDLWYYAKDISFINMTHRLLEDHPDYTFASVYIEGIDLTQHIFMRYARPDLYPKDQRPTAEEEKTLGPVIPNYYQWVDGQIGELLQYANSNTVVGIISDHGTEAGWKNMHYSGDHKKGPPGVIILCGGPIKAGYKIQSARIEDVAPTLLYLLGYPVGEDMDGKVIAEAISENFMEKFPIKKTPTLDTGFKWGGAVGGSAYDSELIEKLKAIGYL